MYWDVPLARASPKLPPCPSEWWLPESSASLLSMTLRGATWSVARAERIALLGWGGWLPFLDGAAGCHLGWHGWSRGLPSSSGEATPLLTCSLIGPRWRTKLSYRRGSVGCYVAVAQPPPRRWQRTCTGGGTRWNAFGTRDVRGALMWTPMGTRHITSIRVDVPSWCRRRSRRAMRALILVACEAYGASNFQAASVLRRASHVSDDPNGTGRNSHVCTVHGKD